MKLENKIKQIEVNKQSKSNTNSDKIYKNILYLLTIATSIIILFSIIFIFINAINVVNNYGLSWVDIIFGNEFDGTVGIISLAIIVINTLWMAFLATLLATPISIGIALIVTRILNSKLSTIMFSVVAILAAIPSVIYGAFGYYVLDPFNVERFGTEIASLLTMVIMVALMIMPTITIMTIASIRLTDRRLEESSYALGANKTQTSFNITLRSAKTGIYVGILFAVGRCLAETTAISMVGSPMLTEGITLSLWQQSLFLGPALLSVNSGEITTSFPIAPLISFFMIVTTISVFAIMKFVEFKNSENNIVKSQSKKATLEREIIDKYKLKGIEKLSVKEQKILISIQRKKQIAFTQNEYFRRPEVSARKILEKSSISSSLKYSKYKAKKTIKHNFIIYGFSLIGIILLLGILTFLFDGGFKNLNWETLTYRGVYKHSSGTMIYGVAIPLMGTLISVLISMSISLPLGIIIGICLSTYLNKNSKFGWMASYIFQMLTSIPSIVWATIAALVFSATIIDEKFIGLEPILFLSIVILPSIIKSIEEASERVNKNQIDGSYALGATTLITTRRIYIRETFPSIISGALLATSIAIAESTLFISILPFDKTPTDMSTWISNGGKTMATAIWDIRRNFPITNYSESLNFIKTFGIILILVILVISFISTQINNKKYYEALILGIALFFVPLGFYINEGSPVIISLSIVLAFISLFIFPIIKNEKIREIFRR